MPLLNATLVQSGYTAVTALSGNATLATNVTLGNTIVVAATAGVTSGASLSAASVTDNLGNTYTRVGVASASTSSVAIFVAPVTVAGACTVSLTGAVTGTGITITPMEWSNLASSTQVDLYQLASTTATTITAPVQMRMPTDGGVVIQVSTTGDSGGSIAARSGFTTVHSVTTVGTTGHVVEYQRTQGKGNWGITTAVNGNGTNLTWVAVAFKAADNRPTITVGPTQQTGTVGGTVTFSVTANSNGGTGLSYQWRKNYTDIPGATSSTYTTPALTWADDDTMYDVVVTDSNGSVTSEARDLVLAGEPITGEERLLAGFWYRYKNRRDGDLTLLRKETRYPKPSPASYTMWSMAFLPPAPATGASGSVAAVTLTAPLGSASGTTVIDASATGAPTAVTLTAPSGTASGGVAAVDGSAAGSVSAVALTAPTGSASGATVIDGNAAASVSAVTLAAPTATASGSTVVNANATGAGTTASLAAPTASASGTALATGANSSVTLTSPTATASGSTVVNASATGSVTAITLSAPTGSASAGTVVDGSATAVVSAITLAAPSATGSGIASATGSVSSVSLVAPDATAAGTTVVNASAAGSVAAITLSAPTGAASNGTPASATGSVSQITLAAPGATATGTTVIDASASGSIAGIFIDAAQAGAAGTTVINASALGAIPQIVLAAPNGSANNLAGPSTTDLIFKILSNKQVLDPVTGKLTVWDDDGVTVLYQANAWEDVAATVPYRGKALARIDKLV